MQSAYNIYTLVQTYLRSHVVVLYHLFSLFFACLVEVLDGLNKVICVVSCSLSEIFFVSFDISFVGFNFVGANLSAHFLEFKPDFARELEEILFLFRFSRHFQAFELDVKINGFDFGLFDFEFFLALHNVHDTDRIHSFIVVLDFALVGRVFISFSAVGHRDKAS